MKLAQIAESDALGNRPHIRSGRSEQKKVLNIALHRARAAANPTTSNERKILKNMQGGPRASVWILDCYLIETTSSALKKSQSTPRPSTEVLSIRVTLTHSLLAARSHLENVRELVIPQQHSARQTRTSRRSLASERKVAVGLMRMAPKMMPVLVNRKESNQGSRTNAAITSFQERPGHSTTTPRTEDRLHYVAPQPRWTARLPRSTKHRPLLLLELTEYSLHRRSSSQACRSSRSN